MSLDVITLFQSCLTRFFHHHLSKSARVLNFRTYHIRYQFLEIHIRSGCSEEVTQLTILSIHTDICTIGPRKSNINFCTIACYA